MHIHDNNRSVFQQHHLSNKYSENQHTQSNELMNKWFSRFMLHSIHSKCPHRRKSGGLISDFPQEHRPVNTRTGKLRPIRAEHDSLDLRPLPGEHLLLFTHLGIPQPHRPVHTPTRKRLAIRAERYIYDLILMLGECTLRFPRLGIPQPHTPIPASKHLSIRAEQDPCEPTRTHGECRPMFTRNSIP